MQKGVFRGVVEDITQPAVINVLVTHERISEDIVHDMAKAIVRQSRHAAADESALQRVERSLRAAALQGRRCLRVRRRTAASGRDSRVQRSRMVEVDFGCYDRTKQWQVAKCRSIPDSFFTFRSGTAVSVSRQSGLDKASADYYFAARMAQLPESLSAIQMPRMASRAAVKNSSTIAVSRA